MGFTTLSLTGRALRLLSQREHSRAELQRKLGPHVQEGEDLNAVLDGLQAKGLGAEAVQQAVARLQDTELERAREVWRRKFGEPAADSQTRAKHMRFLLARGFSGDVVRRAVQGAEGGDED